MTSSSRALLVFTRSPEAEARAKGLAPESAARLFSAFLGSWRLAAEAAGARVVISSPPRCAERFREGRLCEGALVLAQSAERFGERLVAAVEEVFALGFGSVSVVAGDAPAIPDRELDRAFEALEGRDCPVVIGPSCDGGIYLIGLTSAEPDFLSAISLRNPRTCDELVASLKKTGRRVLLLDRRDEVDSLADLQRLYRSSNSSAVWREYRFLLAMALERSISIAASASPIPLLPVPAFVPARAPPAA